MMNYGNFQGMHPSMQQGDPIVCPPEYCMRDEFIPREVPVIHPIVNVNRQHIVDFPRHYYTETTEDVMGGHMMADGCCGPQFGGARGPGFGGWF